MRPIERLEETYFPKGIELLEYMEQYFMYQIMI